MLRPQRILIVRLTAIGDVIHTLPVLSALRERFPQAYLAWAVEGFAGDLLEGHPALNELIRLPRRWLKQPREVFKLRRRLRAAPYDVAIDVQGLTKSGVVSWLSGAKTRISHARGQARELSPWLATERVQARAAHVVDRNLELLNPLGIKQSKASFVVPCDQGAEESVNVWQQQGTLPSCFALINPGAGWPSKLWSSERFAAVARHLDSHGLPTVVVWAGAAEQKMATEIQKLTNGAAVLAPATDLKQLAALCRRAELFVGSDTGPLHLAAAVNTPCVGLFGPMPAERNGPYGAMHIAIQRECLQGSSRHRRNADNQSMLAISVADVTKACDEILGRPSSASLAVA